MWYLDKIQDDIDSEEELLQRKQLVEKIIDRMAYVDKIIIPLTEEGENEDEDVDKMFVVHPNYVVE